MPGSFNQTMKIAEQAKEFMLVHQITPVPSHYAVAYCYVSEENLLLIKKIDEQLASKKSLDAIFIDALFSEFLSNSQNIEDNIFTPFGETLTSTLAQLENHVSSEKATISHLNKIGKTLGQLGEYKPLQNITTFLLNAIGQSTAQHQSLSTELYKASEEVSQLKQKLEESRQEALIDTLTGLLNRRGCDKRLQALSLNNIHSSLVIDIDHFKKVNDSFGHSVGDKVIQLVAKIIKEHVAPDDIPVRYGGEEFVVVLSNKSQQFAHTIAEKIRLAIAKLKLVQRQSKTQLPPITVSIGVAELQNNMTWTTLFNNADQALYKAKDSGRNCCVLASINTAAQLELAN
ncbi:GGDEF domain-containing protein [Colwellia hornerae]|nr:GGDEF domain-containing protein [Colwellia hornerae]